MKGEIYMSIVSIIVFSLIIGGLAFLIVWNVIGIIKSIKNRKLSKQEKNNNNELKKGE